MCACVLGCGALALLPEGLETELTICLRYCIREREDGSNSNQAEVLWDYDRNARNEPHAGLSCATCEGFELSTYHVPSQI